VDWSSFGVVLEQINMPAHRLKGEAAILSRTVRNSNAQL